MCPTYGVSQYKVKDDECSDEATTNDSRPTNVCIPIIPRFKRLFANGHDVENLTWHADGKKVMDYSNIRLILHNGKQSIVCIHILGRSQ